MTHEIHIIPITSIGQISGGDNLAKIISDALARKHISLMTNDILVVTQKVVSKAEGRTIRLETVSPSAFAITISRLYGKDPRHIEVILQQTKRIVRMDKGVLICETHHGFICANAGVDASNMNDSGVVALLPIDPDASARKLRRALLFYENNSQLEISVIISDTWGRPWRNGQINNAIGSSGIDTIIDYRGKKDTRCMTLQATMIAVADELAGAAELVMNKLDNIPVALIRGYHYIPSMANTRSLLRSSENDLFR